MQQTLFFPLPAIVPNVVEALQEEWRFEAWQPGEWLQRTVGQLLDAELE